MKNLYILLITILFSGICHGQLLQIGQDVDGEAFGDNSGYRVALNEDSTILVSSAPFSDSNGLDAGHVRVFYMDSNTWVQLGSTLIGDEMTAQFGVDMEMNLNGDIIAIGEPSYDGGGVNSGLLRVFHFNGNDWEIMGSDIIGNNNEHFGISIGMSDDGLRIAVAGTNSNVNGYASGVVRTYEYVGNEWLQYGSDLYGSQAYDRIGNALSMSSDGNRLAVSKRYNSIPPEGAGEVITYEFDGTEWVQLGQILHGEGNTLGFGEFGYALDLSGNGNILAVSDIYDYLNNTLPDAGRVKLYEFDGSSWIVHGQYLNGEVNGHRFGTKVILNNEGNRIAVAAMYFGEFESQSGQVRIYDFEEGYWIRKYPNINGESENDFSGWSLGFDLSSSYIAIGAVGNDDGGADSGHVRVYNIENLLNIKKSTELKIQIFPNPVDQVLNVRNKGIDVIKSLKLYDVMGRLLHIEKGIVDQIDVSHLNSGVLFLDIETDQGKITKKIIKN